MHIFDSVVGSTMDVGI